MKARKYRRIVRPLGPGREAVRCVDGRWRIFALRTLSTAKVGGDTPGAPTSYHTEPYPLRRWVCVHVGAEVGKWPVEFFATVAKRKPQQQAGDQPAAAA